MDVRAGAREHARHALRWHRAQLGRLGLADRGRGHARAARDRPAHQLWPSGPGDGARGTVTLPPSVASVREAAPRPAEPRAGGPRDAGALAARDGAGRRRVAARAGEAPRGTAADAWGRTARDDAAPPARPRPPPVRRGRPRRAAARPTRARPRRRRRLAARDDAGRHRLVPAARRPDAGSDRRARASGTDGVARAGRADRGHRAPGRRARHDRAPAPVQTVVATVQETARTVDQTVAGAATAQAVAASRGTRGSSRGTRPPRRRRGCGGRR